MGLGHFDLAGPYREYAQAKLVETGNAARAPFAAFRFAFCQQRYQPGMALAQGVCRPETKADAQQGKAKPATDGSERQSVDKNTTAKRQRPEYCKRQYEQEL
jgi:hypothetical protein